MRKYAEKGKKFSGNSKLYQRFESSFNKKQTSCTTSATPEIASIRNDIFQKINALIDPEPAVEKIKNDLIGTKMIGWNFDYPEEFQQCQVSKKINSDKRIDYDLDLILFDQKLNDLHNASATVVYKLNNGEWILSNVISHYITYTFHATTDTWLQVTPFTNCTYAISPTNKFWVKDGQDGQTYKGGGTDADSFTLTSPTFFIASRESTATDIVFTFYPKGN